MICGLVTNIILATKKQRGRGSKMYRGRYFIRQTVYVCGDYMDADIYPVFQAPGKRRKKCRPTSEIQAKLNQKNAERKVTRLVHLNFTKKDIALHLTYNTAPESAGEAQRDLWNFIRRVKRLRKKLELPELKYISCTEFGKKSGRVHHHMILSGGIDRDTLEELWGHGYANSKRLQFHEDGVTGLAHYIVKEKGFYKRWNQSKNLRKPEPIVKDSGISMDQVEEMADAIEKKQAYEYFEAVWPAYQLTEAVYTKNGVNRGSYVHIEMHRARAAGAPGAALPCAIPRKWGM